MKRNGIAILLVASGLVASAPARSCLCFWRSFMEAAASAPHVVLIKVLENHYNDARPQAKGYLPNYTDVEVVSAFKGKGLPQRVRLTGSNGSDCGSTARLHESTTWVAALVEWRDKTSGAQHRAVMGCAYSLLRVANNHATGRLDRPDGKTPADSPAPPRITISLDELRDRIEDLPASDG